MQAGKSPKGIIWQINLSLIWKVFLAQFQTPEVTNWELLEKISNANAMTSERKLTHYHQLALLTFTGLFCKGKDFDTRTIISLETNGLKGQC